MTLAFPSVPEMNRVPAEVVMLVPVYEILDVSYPDPCTVLPEYSMENPPGTVTPEEPDDPVVPDEPEDPAVPDEPADPADPDVPAEPEDPVEPEDPAEPELPELPVDPEDPEDPAAPELPDDPAVPAVPAEPDVPVEPEDPDDPEDPAVPADPAVPEVPAEINHAVPLNRYTLLSAKLKMIVPTGTDVEALLIVSTVGIVNPFPLLAKIIPSEFVILYPDIYQYNLPLIYLYFVIVILEIQFY